MSLIHRFVGSFEEAVRTLEKISFLLNDQHSGRIRSVCVRMRSHLTSPVVTARAIESAG